jgi:hypothetical protein
MPLQAYISAWMDEFSEQVMLERMEQFLELVPFSKSLPGFASLAIRAVGPEEAPVLERDFRNRLLSPAEAVLLAGEHLHGDSSYEFGAYWDLWIPGAGPGGWQQAPQRLEIFCSGPEYDHEGCRETGHFWVHAGFERQFLGPGETISPPTGHEKTRENIRLLLGWAHQMESKLPLARLRIWSEGEADFEARLEEILAAA